MNKLIPHRHIVIVPKTGSTWRKQRQALLAAIRREPNPEEVASLHSAGLTETAVEFVKQQSAFVHKVTRKHSSWMPTDRFDKT